MERDAAVARKLIERRERILAALPSFTEIIRGSLFVRSIRCGKPSCRCAKGTGHPVTYLGVTFPGGRTEQITVPKHLVPAVRRAVANYVRWWRGIEMVSAINRRLLRLRRLTPKAPLTKKSRPSRAPASVRSYFSPAPSAKGSPSSPRGGRAG